MEREKPGRIVIESIRQDGRPLRPGDWIERIASMLATFGRDHRLHYIASVQPCIIQGEKCLVVERDLARKDPGMWEYILHFAHDNALRIQEDRRRVRRPS